MYCYNCGKEIAETVKFCPYCGAEQKQPQQSPQWQQPQQPTQWQNPPAANNSGKNNSWQSRLPIILSAVALVVVVLLAVRAFHNRTDAQNELKAIATTEPAATEAAPTEKVTYTEPPAPTETEALTDGWHTINGKRYYIQDDEKYVDLQEIDNALYYFDEDGALAENEDVDYYGTTLHAGRDGIIGGITYDEIWGNWSDERYSFGIQLRNRKLRFFPVLPGSRRPAWRKSQRHMENLHQVQRQLGVCAGHQLHRAGRML